MTREELLEIDISKFLERNHMGREKIKIRKRPVGKPQIEIFCNMCQNRIASANWDRLIWDWKQHPHACY